MKTSKIFRHSAVRVELGLFALAALWYVAFYKLMTSGKNGLDSIPFGWYWLVVLGPCLTVILAIVLDRELKVEDRPMKFWEIMVVVFVMPQFLAWVYVWWGLLYYMGISR